MQIQCFSIGESARNLIDWTIYKAGVIINNAVLNIDNWIDSDNENINYYGKTVNEVRI